MRDHLNPQRFRVPRENNSLLSIPDLDEADRLVDENRRLFRETRTTLNGRPLTELRAAARREAVAQGLDYTQSLLQREIPAPPFESCVVSGHQPELFHVGVWAKNFALAGIARRNQATAINLVIDNDTLNSTTLRIPTGDRAKLSIDRLPFDTPRPTLPWEEATVLDADLYREFGPLVDKQLRANWGFRPLIGSAWDAAVRSLSVSQRLCDGLTALRAHVERDWGLQNLELPMSRLCQTDSFLWFFAHLLTRLPELHQAYNEVVGDYRRAHRLRNLMQPIPDLESTDGWLEAPFWIWRAGETQRGRLFARRIGAECELRHQNEVVAQFPVSDNESLQEAVELLKTLPARGIRIRTRALTTTLFSRMCLADLFVHGIGGAKYDAMTDQLCARLFGMVAPEFLTVSATLYLPLGEPFPATQSDLIDINHRLRDLNYNPDRHLEHSAQVDPLIAEKTVILEEARRLREQNQLRGHLTPAQHQRLAEIRSQLLLQAEQARAAYDETRAKLRSQLATNALVRNREYAFVLSPEDQLRQFLIPLATR